MSDFPEWSDRFHRAVDVAVAKRNPIDARRRQAEAYDARVRAARAMGTDGYPAALEAFARAVERYEACVAREV